MQGKGRPPKKMNYTSTKVTQTYTQALLDKVIPTDTEKPIL